MSLLQWGIYLAATASHRVYAPKPFDKMQISSAFHHLQRLFFLFIYLFLPSWNCLFSVLMAVEGRLVTDRIWQLLSNANPFPEELRSGSECKQCNPFSKSSHYNLENGESPYFTEYNTKMIYRVLIPRTAGFICWWHKFVSVSQESHWPFTNLKLRASVI